MGIESEILRLVDALRREKDIEPEVIFQGIEAALLSAARKHFGGEDDIVINIDRDTGKINAYEGEREIQPAELGRIAAQTAKQVMIQKIREAERDAIAAVYAARVGSVVNGKVYRLEGPNIIVNLGRTEGFLPKSEQIPSEVFRQGERIRALVIEAKPAGTRVRVLLSRSRAEFVERLFEMEVPEVADGIVEIMAVAREAGYRTKIAVRSTDSKVDAVGACVGVQGSRIKNIVDELNGEKIDIVRWSDIAEELIEATLKPAEIDEIQIANEVRATVIVDEDQLSLAIGKRGQNVRLASKLTGWDIDIVTRAELEGGERPKPGEEKTAKEPVTGAAEEESAEKTATTAPAATEESEEGTEAPTTEPAATEESEEGTEAATPEQPEDAEDSPQPDVEDVETEAQAAEAEEQKPEDRTGV